MLAMRLNMSITVRFPSSPSPQERCMKRGLRHTWNILDYLSHVWGCLGGRSHVLKPLTRRIELPRGFPQGSLSRSSESVQGAEPTDKSANLGDCCRNTLLTAPGCLWPSLKGHEA